MTNNHISALMLCLSLLGGCATHREHVALPEVSSDMYVEEEIAPSTYRISYIGEPMDSSHTHIIHSAALSKAADLARKHNVQSFAVVDLDVQLGVFVPPTPPNTFNQLRTFDERTPPDVRCRLDDCEVVIDEQTNTTKSGAAYLYSMTAKVGDAEEFIAKQEDFFYINDLKKGAQ